MRKLKEQVRWSDSLTTVTNPILAQSEELYSEKLALEREWPSILQAMQDMEPEITAAFQEYELQKGCSFDAKRVQDAQKSLRELRWKRDSRKVSHVKRNEEINSLLQRLTQPVISELIDARPVTGQPLGLLHKEIKSLVGKRIFKQVGEERYENEYGPYRKPVVRNNLSALEQAEKLLLATIEKIRNQTFNPVSKILDTLDEGQDEYLKIDFTKCTKDEFFMDAFNHVVRTQGETGVPEVIWSWQIEGRVEEAKIFEKEIVVKEKVGKVFGK